MSITATGRKISDVLVSDRRGPPLSDDALVVSIGLALLGATCAGLLLNKQEADQPLDQRPEGLYAGSALLAGSVLADSALEHFRGNYLNRAMIAPPFAAAANITTSLQQGSPTVGRGTLFAASSLIGIAGLGFHLYNILKRPGGFSWNNLFYAAPIAAPGALALSGALGLAGERLAKLRQTRAPITMRRRLIRGVAFLLSGGIFATVGEVALLHFRGAFHDPFMYAPVTAPPLAAATLAAAAAKPTPKRIRLARFMLKTTAALGVAGVGFHIFGVSRNMGGWANWTQNLFQGPPLPAPPSFTGLALAGLNMLRVLEEEGQTDGKPPF